MGLSLFINWPQKKIQRAFLIVDKVPQDQSGLAELSILIMGVGVGRELRNMGILEIISKQNLKRTRRMQRGKVTGLFFFFRIRSIFPTMPWNLPRHVYNVSSIGFKMKPSRKGILILVLLIPLLPPLSTYPFLIWGQLMITVQCLRENVCYPYRNYFSQFPML